MWGPVSLANSQRVTSYCAPRFACCSFCFTLQWKQLSYKLISVATGGTGQLWHIIGISRARLDVFQPPGIPGWGRLTTLSHTGSPNSSSSSPQSKTGALEGVEVDGFVKDMMGLVRVRHCTFSRREAFGVVSIYLCISLRPKSQLIGCVVSI